VERGDGARRRRDRLVGPRERPLEVAPLERVRRAVDERVGSFVPLGRASGAAGHDREVARPAAGVNAPLDRRPEALMLAAARADCQTARPRKTPKFLKFS